MFSAATRQCIRAVRGQGAAAAAAAAAAKFHQGAAFNMAKIVANQVIRMSIIKMEM